MRRLKRILADANTDNLLIKFKEIVTLEQISGKIQELYELWSQATYGEIGNMEHFEEWFADYYDSVLADCVNNAKEDEEFSDKYNNLTGDEINELEEQIKDYIVNNKEIIQQTIEQNASEQLSLDNPEPQDIYNSNEYEEDDDFEFDSDLIGQDNAQDVEQSYEQSSDEETEENDDNSTEDESSEDETEEEFSLDEEDEAEESEGSEDEDADESNGEETSEEESEEENESDEEVEEEFSLEEDDSDEVDFDLDSLNVQ